MMLSTRKVDIFLDGNLISTAERECNPPLLVWHLGSNGLIYLGKDPMKTQYFVGKIADVRLYRGQIDKSVVSDAKSFQTDFDYEEIWIDFPYENLKNFVFRTTKKIDFVASFIRSRKFKYLETKERKNHTSSEKTCTALRGNLLDVPPGKDTTEAIMANAFLRIADSFDGRTLTTRLVWVKKSENEEDRFNTLCNTLVTLADCSSLHTALCNIPQTVQYKLIGLRDEPIVVHLIETEGVFESDRDVQVRFEKDRLTIYSTITGNKLYTSVANFEMEKLMGRKLFRDEKTGKELSLSLSACSDDEFTCTNGDCVNLLTVCDSNTDCLDGSDEGFCNVTVNRMESYNRELSGGSPLPLGIRVVMNRLVDVDMSESTITVELTINITWVDTRAVFYNIHPGHPIRIPKNDAKFYWHPNVILRCVSNDNKNIFSLDENPGKMFISTTANGTPSTFGSYEGIMPFVSNCII